MENSNNVIDIPINEWSIHEKYLVEDRNTYRLPLSDSSFRKGKRVLSASATFCEPFVSMFIPIASPALAFRRMCKRFPETKHLID